MRPRANSRPSSGACSSRRARGACIRESKDSPRDRSACVRPTRDACASSGETPGGEQAGAGPGAPAGLARPLGADGAGGWLRGAHGARGLPPGRAHRFPAGKGRCSLFAGARDSGHARPHPRPQRRGSRGFHPGKVGLGHSGRRRSFRLAALLSISLRQLEKKISDASKDFVYLKRQVPPETATAVQALGLKGIYEHPEYRRYYPGGEVTAHVIGFTGVDDTGQEGIELAQQAILRGKPGSRRVIRDRLGRIIEDVESIRPGQDGVDLTLSLDSKIQNVAYGALKAAVERHGAKAGALIAID